MRGFRGVAVFAAGALSLAVGAMPAGAVRPNIPRAIACPSVSLCVAVDDAGYVLSSTNPTGGAATWRSAQVDGGLAMSGVSCASPALCVAFDEVDGIVTSTNPTGGAHAWKRVELSQGPSGLSCPSVTLCVGVDDAEIITSTNPTGPASAWTSTELAGGRHALFSVACVSAALCLAPDVDHTMRTSTNPAGGAETWTSVPVAKGFWFSVACAPGTDMLCMTVDGIGNAATTTSPTASSWTTATGAPNEPAPQLACPSVTLCVVAGQSGISTTTTPLASAGSWRTVALAHLPAELVGLACPSVTLCVAIDDRGDAFTSTTPAAGATTWTRYPFERLTHKISQSDLLLDMRASLDVLGQAAPRAAKVRQHGYPLLFDDLDTGVLTLGWYQRATRIAAGRVKVPDTGRATVTVRFTAAGRRLVAAAHMRRVTLRAKAVLTRAGSAPLTATKTFVLRP